MIRRICVLKKREVARNRRDELDKEMYFVQTRIKLLDLVELLKTRETLLPHLLDLLDLICERFPSRTNRPFVKVSFPGHESRSVGPIGFQLLEAVEAALGTTEQRLELAMVDVLEDHLLAALASRLARQQNTSQTTITVRRRIVCKKKDDCLAISSLMQNCNSFNLNGILLVPQDIGRDGWAALKEALSWRLHDIPRIWTGLKAFMLSADREDLREIWDSVSLMWLVSRSDGSFVDFKKDDGEVAWQRLEQFLDISSGEWRALYPGLAPSLPIWEVEEIVKLAWSEVGSFMNWADLEDLKDWSPQKVQNLVQAVNRAFEALHQARRECQYVQSILDRLTSSMRPLNRFEARLQAHGVHLAIPGGPIEALVQLAQPLLFNNLGADGAAEAPQVQDGGDVNENL